VIVWAIAGALLFLEYSASQKSHRRAVVPPVRFPATAFVGGWVFGCAIGFVAHEMPAQLALIWYVLTGWQG